MKQVLLVLLTLGISIVTSAQTVQNNSQTSSEGVKFAKEAPPITEACKAELTRGDELLERADMHSYEGAAESYRKAIDAQYDCVPALIGYTFAIISAHPNRLTIAEYREAYEYIARALVLDPNNAKAYWVMANLMRVVGKPLKAIALLERSINLNPQDPMAYFVLGSVLIGQDNENAIKILKKALELNPDLKKARHNLAAAYILTGKFRDAEKLLAELVANNPTDDFAITNLGVARLSLGNLNSAEELFTKAIQLNPAQPQALKGLGDVKMAKKKYAEAIEAYKKFLDLAPNEATIWFLLGEAQEGMTDYSSAIQSYRKALELEPNFQEAKKRIESLPH